MRWNGSMYEDLMKWNGSTEVLIRTAVIFCLHAEWKKENRILLKSGYFLH